MFQYKCIMFRQNSASFKNQLEMINCYLQGSLVCSSFAFDAD